MKIVSQVIRDSARGESCTLRIPDVCNFDPATTVFCHLPANQRGMGIKTPDIAGCYGCSSCHDVLDGRRHSEWIDWRNVLRAMVETQLRLIEKGLLVVCGEKHARPALLSKILKHPGVINR
jgi:hypothetical protein